MISLNVLERLLLLNLLPKEGSLVNLKLIRVAREALSFTEEENEQLKFKQEGDQLRWNEAVGEKEFNLGAVVTKLAVEGLKELDKKEKLTEGHVSLYDKLVGE